MRIRASRVKIMHSTYILEIELSAMVAVELGRKM
jgi:hypothetical protein